MRKRWLMSAVVLAWTSIPAAGAGTPMTDDTVVQMLQNGFGPDVIIARIKTSITAFDVSDSSLIELKKNNVPDSVIAAMISAGASVRRGSAGTRVNFNRGQMHAAGK